MSVASMTAVAAVVVAGLAGWLLPRDNIRRIDQARLRRGGMLATSSLGGPCGAFAGTRLVRTLRRSWSARRNGRRRRAAVIDLCQAVSAELSAGAAPRGALALAAEGGELAVLAEVARSSYGDLPAAMARLADVEGYAALRRLAACWRVGERSGVGLAVAIARLADALRDDEQVRREISAQLAGPKATGVLLGLLPIFGLLMAAAVGARPLDLLLHTRAGLVLCALGIFLELVGAVWMARIIRHALPP